MPLWGHFCCSRMTPNPPALLTLQQLRLLRGGLDLGLQISAQFGPGQLWHITGANGTGKTTLLLTLCAVIPAYSGQVTCAFAEPAYLYIGRKSACDAGLTALQNLMALAYLSSNAINLSQNAAQQKASIMQALAALGMAKFSDIPFGHLSSGQQQKVMLARLWLPNLPRIWLLDEPFTALDQATSAILSERLQQHTDNHGLVLTTSHTPLAVASHQLNLAQCASALTGDAN